MKLGRAAAFAFLFLLSFSTISFALYGPFNTYKETKMDLSVGRPSDPASTKIVLDVRLYYRNSPSEEWILFDDVPTINMGGGDIHDFYVYRGMKSGANLIENPDPAEARAYVVNGGDQIFGEWGDIDPATKMANIEIDPPPSDDCFRSVVYWGYEALNPMSGKYEGYKPVVVTVPACGTGGAITPIDLFLKNAANMALLQSLCLPLVLLLGLLMASMYVQGKNVLGAFDFSSPRVSGGRPYSMRKGGSVNAWGNVLMSATTYAGAQVVQIKGAKADLKDSTDKKNELQQKQGELRGEISGLRNDLRNSQKTAVKGEGPGNLDRTSAKASTADARAELKQKTAELRQVTADLKSIDNNITNQTERLNGLRSSFSSLGNMMFNSNLQIGSPVGVRSHYFVLPGLFGLGGKKDDTGAGVRSSGMDMLRGAGGSIGGAVYELTRYGSGLGMLWGMLTGKVETNKTPTEGDVSAGLQALLTDIPLTQRFADLWAPMLATLIKGIYKPTGMQEYKPVCEEAKKYEALADKDRETLGNLAREWDTATGNLPEVKDIDSQIQRLQTEKTTATPKRVTEIDAQILNLQVARENAIQTATGTSTELKDINSRLETAAVSLMQNHQLALASDAKFAVDGIQASSAGLYDQIFGPNGIMQNQELSQADKDHQVAALLRQQNRNTADERAMLAGLGYQFDFKGIRTAEQLNEFNSALVNAENVETGLIAQIGGRPASDVETRQTIWVGGATDAVEILQLLSHRNAAVAESRFVSAAIIEVNTLNDQGQNRDGRPITIKDIRDDGVALIGTYATDADNIVSNINDFRARYGLAGIEYLQLNNAEQKRDVEEQWKSADNPEQMIMTPQLIAHDNNLINQGNLLGIISYEYQRSGAQGTPDGAAVNDILGLYAETVKLDNDAKNGDVNMFISQQDVADSCINTYLGFYQAVVNSGGTVSISGVEQGYAAALARGENGLREFVNGDAGNPGQPALQYIAYIDAKEAMERMESNRLLSAYINTVPEMKDSEGRIVTSLPLLPEQVNVDVARSTFGFGASMSPEEVRERVSLAAEVYNLGNEIGLAEKWLHDNMSSTVGDATKEPQLIQSCNDYYQVGQLQKEYEAFLNMSPADMQTSEDMKEKLKGIKDRLEALTSLQGISMLFTPTG